MRVRTDQIRARSDTISDHHIEYAYATALTYMSLPIVHMKYGLRVSECQLGLNAFDADDPVYQIICTGRR